MPNKNSIETSHYTASIPTMKLSIQTSFLLLAAGSSVSEAFVPVSSKAFVSSSSTALNGYLDDLSKDLYAPDATPDIEGDKRENNKMKEDEKDRYGPGNWKDFVDFDEFDGGDGQMGVAGDGNKGLEKEWKGQASMGKSKMMSAKNAWGSSSGYAAKLIDEGMEATRAQQFENWGNQQEVLASRKAHRYMTDDFDSETSTADEDWRKLSKFGVERNEDFDLDETMGAIVPGDEIVATVELKARVGQTQIYEFNHKNSFMGFADFRARFTPETSGDWKITPTEGSLNGKAGTDFIIKYRPQNPGVSEGYLVIQTEEDKWTWKLIGGTS